jgi:putative isomerase
MKARTILLVLGLMPFLLSCDAGNKNPVNENHVVGQAGLPENHLATPGIDLAKGWNTWDTYSVLSHVLLPQGLAIKLQLLDGQSGEILEDALIGRSAFDSMEHVTAGPHAYDGSYTELELEWHDIHVRVQSAVVDDELYLLVTPLDMAPGDSLIVKPQMMWDREGEVSISQDVITAKTPTETIDLFVYADQPAAATDHISVSLAKIIAVSTNASKTIEGITSVIDSARTDFLSERSDYGSSVELFDAMQTVLAWNVIYEPTNDRVITPVSRRWNVGWGGWILFEWDTYFAAYMHALNNKELAYANVFAMTSEITDRGFVPNFASSRNKSEDRSEPPVGSFVVKEIYRKYREDWFVHEVFDELLSWNRWWADNRDIDGYLAWGSDPYEHDELAEWLEKGIGAKQGAKWESGLDNSPMFDDAVFDTETHQLMLADVGHLSLYILDFQSQSDLACVL